jgi:hypothetical protein
MKRLCLILLLIPLFGMGQIKNVVNINRIFPKPDKIAEFEKALTAHTQKFHTGDWKWRVFQIESGPDAGGYSITEGPNSWTDLDGRSDLGAEHMADWAKNVAPLTTGAGSSSYMLYREEFSTVPVSDFAEKISVTHVFPKVGYGLKLEANFKKAKKVWEGSQENVVIYQSHFSGPAQYMIVYRHKQGWKEKEKDFRKPFIERYNTTYGENSYDEYLEVIQRYIDSAWSEMLTMRSDLSSK